MTTVIFIHGISNMPEPGVLQSLWENAFASDRVDNPGIEIGAYGASVELVYWSDVLYGSPARLATGAEGADPSFEILNASRSAELNLDVVSDDWIQSLSSKLGINPDEVVDGSGIASFTGDETVPTPAEAIPLPWPLKKPLMRAFVRDAHHYLFNIEHSPRPGESFRVRDEIRQRFVGKVEDAVKKGSVIVLSHSMGTVIAYDCLKNVPNCPDVQGLITVGSPLGMSEMQDKMDPGYSKNDGYPHEKLIGNWQNVYDPVDLVSFADPILSNDYRMGGQRKVSDLRQNNGGVWTHGMLKYAAKPVLREVLKEALVAT